MSTTPTSPGPVASVLIRTAHLHIRELETSDWPDVHRYAADPRVVEFLWWGPNSEEDTRRFIEKARNERVRRPRLDFDLVVSVRRLEVGSDASMRKANGRPVPSSEDAACTAGANPSIGRARSGTASFRTRGARAMRTRRFRRSWTSVS
jgi:hypothetical protein